jgi:hypothetical protein
MTEQQILAFAWQLGPWAGLVVCVTYIIVNKVGPVWLADWRDKRKQTREADEAERLARIKEDNEERKTVITLYERLVAQNVETVRYIASATEAIHSFTRALDGNTLQIYQLTQSVERGPKCPLPDCPFMGKEK